MILLIIGCLLPGLAAQIYSQVNLSQERRQQFGAVVLRQAELASSDVASVIDGVHQLSVLAAQVPAIAQMGGGCDKALDTLRAGLTRYRFLAVVDRTNQKLLCASDGADAGLIQGVPGWMREITELDTLAAGRVVFPKGSADGIVPVVVAMPSSIAGDASTVLIAGLSVRWLDGHLRSAQAEPPVRSADPDLFVTDRDGVVIGHTGGASGPVPTRLPAWISPVIARDSAGIATLEAPGHRSAVVGYVPFTVRPLGIAVVGVVTLPRATAGLDEANGQNLLVTAIAACVALALALSGGRRFIVRPTEKLMQAARRWRAGDLGARADLGDTGSEFAGLAQSFNAMAAGLEAREAERQAQSHVLEAQVRERTRELSESNNRLQVEISGREKTEAALHQARKLQAVGQLAGGIAHDFNNMLATILGNLELMERRLPRDARTWAEADKERLLRLIERATGAVLRGGQLTSRLLAFSRQQRLAARATDVNALLQELITLAASTLGPRIQVVPDLTGDLWPAMVDPSQVEAGILNLCLNARDAMTDGGTLTIATDNFRYDPRIPADHEDRDLTSGDYVRIRISDTGTGMTPDVKARAFDPFFTTKGAGAGSGLGLSQVHGMARQCGGSVTIDSVPGEGTIVTLLLPRAPQAEEPEAITRAEPSATQAPPLFRDLVLVVDDDQAVRQVTVEMAHDLGYDVVQASGGKQALALLASLASPPRFILLDYAMPGMNGLQLAVAIAERKLTAPIALVTGYADLSEADMTTISLAGLLRKPFTIRELEQLLNQLRAAEGTDNKAIGLEAPLIEG